MSSVTQSSGRSRRNSRGHVVHELFLYLIDPERPKAISDYREPVTLTRPNGAKGAEPRLYRIWRRPAGMFGCWVLWNVNGQKYPLDLSVPAKFDRLPRDAEPLTDEESVAYWYAK